MVNAKEAGTHKMGHVVGTFKAPIMLCEDSVLFQQELMYSVETRSKVVLWCCPPDIFLAKWPSDLKKDAMVRCMEKYRWLFERIARIDSQLA